jgi:hypothetical protein
VLCNNYSDEIELEEHDYSLLQSVIENLQSYLSKAKKVHPFLLFLSKSCQFRVLSMGNTFCRPYTQCAPFSFTVLFLQLVYFEMRGQG